MTKPNVALTYNDRSVDSGTVLTLRALLKKFPINLIDCNYNDVCEFDNEQCQDRLSNATVLDGLDDIFKATKQKAFEFIADKDCLILSGSKAMVDTRLYGLAKDEEETNLRRNIGELCLIHCALIKGIPILAICAGLQILNVYLGGTLKDLTIDDLLLQSFAVYNEIKIKTDTDLQKLLTLKDIDKNPTSTRVFGTHFQVINQLGGSNKILNRFDLIKISATACDTSENIEAIESQYGVNVAGFQFHPEVSLNGLPLEDADLKGFSSDIYLPDNEDDFKRILNVFLSTISAAKTYSNKKQVLAEIKMSETIDTSNSIEEADNNLPKFKLRECSADEIEFKKNKTKDFIKHRLAFLADKKVNASPEDDVKGIDYQHYLNNITYKPN